MDTVSKLSVQGYLSIRQLDSLNLRPLNVLIGANGAGKSNLLSVFELLGAAVSRRLQSYVLQAGGGSALLFQGADTTSQMRIEVEWSSANGPSRYVIRLSHAAPDRLVFTEETLWFHRRGQETPYQELLGSAHLESALLETAPTKTKETVRRTFRSRLQPMRVYHFHDTSARAPARLMSDVDQCTHLRHDAGNLAAYLHFLRESYPFAYSRIVAAVSQVAPFFEDFVLEPQPSSVGDKILLRWRSRDSAFEFGPHHLSDGTLRAIALITLLLQPSVKMPGLIVLDEPELGLHPQAIELVASLVRSAADNAQIIVSTQSPAFVDQFSPEDLIIVEQHNGESALKRLDQHELDAWLQDFSLGELMTRNITGGLA